MGFVVNRYDMCVANKEVNGSQMTICWHEDDLKVSHKDPAELEKCVKVIKGIYGDKTSVTRGPLYDYLGMDLDYSEEGVVNISMIKYMDKILKAFPEEIGKVFPGFQGYLYQQSIGV